MVRNGRAPQALDASVVSEPYDEHLFSLKSPRTPTRKVPINDLSDLSCHRYQAFPHDMETELWQHGLGTSARGPI